MRKRSVAPFAFVIRQRISLDGYVESVVVERYFREPLDHEIAVDWGRFAMVGGVVRGVYKFADRISLYVQDGNDFCAVDLPLEASQHGIKKRDRVWWQSKWLLWNPHDEDVQDFKIERLGYSYDHMILWDRIYKLCKAGICPTCSKDNCMHDGLGSLVCLSCGESIKAQVEGYHYGRKQ